MFFQTIIKRTNKNSTLFINSNKYVHGKNNINICNNINMNHNTNNNNNNNNNETGYHLHFNTTNTFFKHHYHTTTPTTFNSDDRELSFGRSFLSKRHWKNETQKKYKKKMDPKQIDLIRNSLISKDDVHDIYSFKHEIGTGAFGSVYFASTKDEYTTPVAIKVMDKIYNPFCYREAQLIQKISHPNVLDCKSIYEDEDNMYIVSTAYSGGELYDFVSENLGRISPKRTFEIGLDMLKALEACHVAGFAHLDVKPENFIFQNKKIGAPLLLIDFGSSEPFVQRDYAETAAEYDPEKDDEITDLERLTGTAMYMPPEVALAAKFSSRSDVWSVGVTLFLMIAGHLPYETHEDKKTPLFETLTNKSDPVLQSLRPTHKELLSSMLQIDSASRCSATEAILQLNAILDDLNWMKLKTDENPSNFDRVASTKPNQNTNQNM